MGYFIVSDEGAKSGHAPCKGGNGISQVKYIIKRVTHQDTAGQAPRTQRVRHQEQSPLFSGHAPRTKSMLTFAGHAPRTKSMLQYAGQYTDYTLWGSIT